MKVMGNKILCGAFLLLCLVLPVAGMGAMLAGYTGSREENRALAAFPEITSWQDIEAFPEQFEEWYNDHLFLKSNLIEAKSRLEAGMFHELDSEKVILGTKKPWLFHCSSDGQPLETYKRTNRFSEDELAAIGENLWNLQSELGELDIRFVLMISPDKEQVYGGDYMPASIRVQEGETRTEQLVSYLKEQLPELTVVYPLEAIRAAKESGSVADLLYYESDTHWNRAGASIGAGELLAAIGQVTGQEPSPIPGSFTALDPETGEIQKVRGDLQKMVQLGPDYDSLEYFRVTEDGKARVKEEEGLTWLRQIRDGNQEVVLETTQCDDGACMPVKVYLSGDSFRWNLGEYVKKGVAEATIGSRYYFDPEDLVAQEPQVFVYMIAERYLQELSLLPGYNTAALPLPK